MFLIKDNPNNKVFRCQQKCIDGRRCKHKTRNIYLLQEKYSCFTHANIYAGYYATIIQKIYRSYRKRKFIKNVYIDLPEEIQDKIIFYVKQDHHYKKYKDILFNILYRKISIYNTNLVYHSVYYNSSYLAHIYKNSKSLENLFYYYDKYFPVMVRINSAFIIVIKNIYDRFKNSKESYNNQMQYYGMNQESVEFMDYINNLYFVIEKYYKSIKQKSYTYNITYDGYGRTL